MWFTTRIAIRCDLLENIYLCGINNNLKKRYVEYDVVVICLKISTFVVSITTNSSKDYGQELL